jgi:hypothetical protein
MYKGPRCKIFGMIENGVPKMPEIGELITKGSAFPMEYVLALIALAAMALAAFAIHAICSIARRKDD